MSFRTFSLAEALERHLDLVFLESLGHRPDSTADSPPAPAKAKAARSGLASQGCRQSLQWRNPLQHFSPGFQSCTRKGRGTERPKMGSGVQQTEPTAGRKRSRRRGNQMRVRPKSWLVNSRNCVHTKIPPSAEWKHWDTRDLFL